MRDEDCTEWLRGISPSFENYRAQDILNSDDTDLFFECLPDTRLTTKNRKCHRVEYSKQRLTLKIGPNIDVR